MQRITDKVEFHCGACGMNQLISMGAVRTEDNRIYVVFECGACEEPVPIEIENIIASLYGPTPGSETVN